MIRLIQVGFGGWGLRWYKDILHPRKDVEVTAFVDSSQAALERLRQAAGVPAEKTFTSLAEALDEAPADAVLVTTGIDWHTPVCEEALLAGKHVLVEKPFTLQLDEAQRLVELADRQQRILMVAQNYRRHPAVHVARKIVAERMLGRVEGVRYVFNSPSLWVPSQGESPERDPVTAVAIHHFDGMRAILASEALRVLAWPMNASWRGFDFPANFAALIEFANETVVNYQYNGICHDAPTFWAGEARFSCENGEFVFTGQIRAEDPEADRVVVFRKGEPAVEQTMPNMTEIGRGAVVAEFAQAVAAGFQPETSGRDNLQTLALTLAVQESLKTGREIHL